MVFNGDIEPMDPVKMHLNKRIAWMGRHRRLKLAGVLAAALLLFFGAGTVPAATPTIPGFYGKPGKLPTVPGANTLPQIKHIVQGIAGLEKPAANELVVRQSEPHAIIEWSRFNIGVNASTHFDQQGNSSWTALNRIYDADPSLIYGKLSADGKIYLINQNGIFFSPSSRVDVYGLIASSLNIADADFLADRLQFLRENYRSPGEELAGEGTVANHGILAAENGGSIILLAPRVENAGTLQTPFGRAILAAGTEAELRQDQVGGVIKFVVDVSGETGSVYNYESGQLIADQGTAGLYGQVINQDGLVRTVTAIRSNGVIELIASERITTGPESRTESPISTSDEPVHESFIFSGGSIELTAGNRIVHQGAIIAPSGDVRLTVGGTSQQADEGNGAPAAPRIFLADDSRIDVSGTWADIDMSRAVVEVQLNSVELRDEFLQKGGLLQGETISLLTVTGSSIGITSSHLASEELTAMERATLGGEIWLEAAPNTYTAESGQTIAVEAGEIIAQPDASFDFSGGGYIYDEELVATTMLMANGKLYDIADAPDHLYYELIMGPGHPQEKVYERYGITESYEGIYFGGVTSLNNLCQGWTEGHDAGSLYALAGTVALDGMLDGGVTIGEYQTLESEMTDEDGNVTSRGLERPTGGYLKIGGPYAGGYYEDRDPVVENIKVVVDEVSVAAAMGPDDPLPEDRQGLTVVSVGIVNEAGLDQLFLSAREEVVIDPEATIRLGAGGHLTAAGRKLSQMGRIEVPGGEVDLVLASNLTTEPDLASGDPNPYYSDPADPADPWVERIFLMPGASIDVSGEQIDNSRADSGEGVVIEGFIDGGRITISDGTIDGEGILLAADSVLNVSGGYRIHMDGKVQGGDAGAIYLQGPSLVMDGAVAGHSVEGCDGGTISLHAYQVEVRTDEATALPDGFGTDTLLPETMQNRLVIGDDYLQDSGFTDIRLKALLNVQVMPGVDWVPSTVKMATPTAASESGAAMAIANRGQALTDGAATVRIEPDTAGDSRVELAAGKAFDEEKGDMRTDAAILNAASVAIAPGAAVGVHPEGEILLSGKRIEVAGSLEAPAGSISLDAAYNIDLADGARVLASGYNRTLTPEVQDLPVYTSLAGGTVSLSAGESLLIADEVLIDVSGAPSVTSYLAGAMDKPELVQTASAPGTLEMTFGDEFRLNGTIRARTVVENGIGGELSIERTNAGQGMVLDGAILEKAVEGGFDALSVRSLHSIVLSGDMNADIGRRLSLNAPALVAENGERVRLSAPWLRVINDQYLDIPEPAEGDGHLELEGTWIDLFGNVTVSGFEETTLRAQRDVTLSDHYYNDRDSDYEWAGRFESAGDITLTAERIYPTTRSDVTVQSGGTLTIRQSGEVPGEPVYSAGGSLTLFAERIEHAGTLLAPIGAIRFKGRGEESRIYLAEGSVTSTKGEVAAVYGALDEDAIEWQMFDKPANKSYRDQAVEAPPDNSISFGQTPDDLLTDENPFPDVIIRDGALIDASGGGGVFAYRFRSGIEGSDDPLRADGRYVVLPADPMALPGFVTASGEFSEGVHLEGVEGLPAGDYVFLPESYAFVEGAIILEDMGTDPSFGTISETEEHTPVVRGTPNAPGTQLQAAQPHYYAVYDAEAILSRGNYTVFELTAGNGGTISIVGDTTILDGRIEADKLYGASSGFFSHLDEVVELRQPRGVDAVEEHTAGHLTLSGTLIDIGAGVAPLPIDFTSETPIPEELSGRLYVDAGGLAEGNFETIHVGDSTGTESIEVASGAILQAGLFSLSAADRIRIDSGASIEATRGLGTIELNAPDGEVVLEQGASLHASDEIDIETANFTLGGDVLVDNSRLRLRSDRIFIGGVDAGVPVAEGLHIDTDLLLRLSTIDTLVLETRSDLFFLSDQSVRFENELIIDADRIAPFPETDATVRLTSARIGLLNTELDGREAPTSQEGTGTGAIILDAGELYVEFGRVDDAANDTNDIRFEGFDTVGLRSGTDMTFIGNGTLSAPADLAIEAGRMTLGVAVYPSYGESGQLIHTFYETADVTIEAGRELSTLPAMDAEEGGPLSPGGRFVLKAQNILHGGSIAVPSGQIVLQTKGAGSDQGVFLQAGSRILGSGSAYMPGSLVRLQSTEGAVAIDSDSLIDVSAGGQGDAGSIQIVTPEARTRLDGTLRGERGSGYGGSFSLDAKGVDNLDDLLTNLSEGGFFGDLELRLREGDAVLGPEIGIEASRFSLSADNGGIDLYARISASGAFGGLVSLSAASDLTLHPGSVIAVNNPEGDAAVRLGSTNGCVLLLGSEGEQEAARVDFGNTGGSLRMRVGRWMVEDPAKLALSGTVRGADNLMIEAVAVYTGQEAVTTSILDSYLQSSVDYMTEASALLNTIPGPLQIKDSDAELRLQPGIEIQSDAAVMRVSPGRNATDLTVWREFGLENGVLTIRSAGELRIERSLVDHPNTDMTVPGPIKVLDTLRPEGQLDSWDFTFVAGADLSAANPLSVCHATETGEGRLSIDDDVQVYTESGWIRLASAGDTAVGNAEGAFGYSDYATTSYLFYSLGTFDGPIEASVGGDLLLGSSTGSGVIQSSAGDIRLKISGDLDLKANNAPLGAVRTVGVPPDVDALAAEYADYADDRHSFYWLYDQGGSIRIDAEGNILSSSGSEDPWDSKYFGEWTPSYLSKDALQGIATMAGGDLTLFAGSDIKAAAGTFGEGDLAIYAGGNLDGRFLIRDGRADLHALQNFGTTQNMEDAPIEAFAADIHLTAQGDVLLGTILNPTIANSDIGFTSSWNLQYATDSAVTIESINGDVRFTGSTMYYGDAQDKERRRRILPPTLSVHAGGSIYFDNYFYLAPSPTGNLTLVAGGDIDGGELHSQIIMSDLDPSTVYGENPLGLAPPKPQDGTKGGDYEGAYVRPIINGYRHSGALLHADDPQTATIQAGGEIHDISLFIPKPVAIQAGGDIRDIFLHGQNLDPADVTSIRTGGDIYFTSEESSGSLQAGFEVGGPGLIFINAGNSIDLGTTDGIQAIGNLYNTSLGSAANHLLLLVGTEAPDDLETVRVFFDALREVGVEYSLLLAEGKLGEADEAVRRAREDIIAQMIGTESNVDKTANTYAAVEPENRGNLNMVHSQIQTSGGPGDIMLLTLGELNVGESTFGSGTESDNNTGIYTTAGGAINIFSEGDVNVNESRVMTFFGGDITIWSDSGNINAGRGSKTTISVSEPRVVEKTEIDPATGEEVGTGEYEIVFDPPAVGSGVRTLTFDPDGVEGPREPPLAGDAYLFAPSGEIDAGEAGISGRNVILGATRVVNAENISFSQGSVGVPVASEGAGGMGALAGAGSVSQAAQLGEESAMVQSARDSLADQAASQLAESLVPKWLDVKVISFETE